MWSIPASVLRVRCFAGGVTPASTRTWKVCVAAAGLSLKGEGWCEEGEGCWLTGELGSRRSTTPTRG